MPLDFESSQRAAQFFLSFKRLKGWTDSKFSKETGNEIPASSLQRIIVTGIGLTAYRAMTLAEVVVAHFPCSFDVLGRYIIEDVEPPPLIQELACGKVFELKHESLCQLLAALVYVESHSELYEEVATVPSPQFLTVPVMNKLYQNIAVDFGRRVKHRSTLIRHFARRRQNRFMFGVGRKPLRTNFYILEDGLHDLLLRILPEAGCTKSEIDALVEFWIFDCLYNRNVHFGIFQTRSNVAATVRSLKPYETVALFNRQTALIRYPQMPGSLLVSAASSSGGAAIVDRHASAIDNIRTAVPYDLDDKFEIEQVLRRLLSRRTWADRAMNAHLYRSVSLN